MQCSYQNKFQQVPYSASEWIKSIISPLHSAAARASKPAEASLSLFPEQPSILSVPQVKEQEASTRTHTHTHNITSPPCTPTHDVQPLPRPAISAVGLADERGRGWRRLDVRWSSTLLFYASLLSRKRPVSESQRTKVMMTMMTWEKRNGIRVQRDGECCSPLFDQNVFCTWNYSSYSLIQTFRGSRFCC